MDWMAFLCLFKKKALIKGRKVGEVGMRLIDADALVAKIMVDAPDFMDGGSSITKAFIMAMIKTRSATPTIDAVPVVRCKDCKHWYFADNRIPSEQENVCGRNGIVVTPNWFCADGERKEVR